MSRTAERRHRDDIHEVREVLLYSAFGHEYTEEELAELHALFLDAYPWYRFMCATVGNTGIVDTNDQ